ncbi:MAG: ABC transporter ATP-binding protein [SAR324 cluster bacterium]|nr:ABC transporter ATP-binding protein [SAR324 cluster bacterium]
MANSNAVLVESLSKKYKLYPSPQARLKEFLHPFHKRYHKEFWALNDVSFQVPQGHTFGVIGRNGSGKSTLLQLITGVIQPTNGMIVSHGKISALLELGSGFNPEFSGRENVMVQASVMGLTTDEIKSQMAEIEAFADLGGFIDQPVKTYSSGMYVRLAFSTAIHVNPDILIVDEALAVGDAKFQSKCFRKFEQFRKDGKTIILVTHDPNAIVRYCDTALLLDNGSLVEMGTPKTIVNHYMELLNTGSLSSKKNDKKDEKPEEVAHAGYQLPDATRLNTPLGEFLKEFHTEDRCPLRNSYNPNEHRYGTRQAEIIDYMIVNKEEYDPAGIRSHDELEIYLKIKFNEDVEFPIYGVTLKTLDGIEVYGNNSWFSESIVHPHSAGSLVLVQMRLNMIVAGGDYFLNLGVACKPPIGDSIALDRRYDLVHLKVLQESRSLGFVDLDATITEYKTLSTVVS